MTSNSINWNESHIYKVGNKEFSCDDDIEPEELRKEIEPWLSAVFQSEHLSLLLGNGLTLGLCNIAKVDSQGMGRLNFKHELKDKIIQHADETAKKLDRGKANLEDDLRTALELLQGLKILDETSNYESLRSEIDSELSAYINSILKSERDFLEKSNSADEVSKSQVEEAIFYMKSFLLSFASRAASRERLNIFTSNYERFIEFGCDNAGILLLDRFRGEIIPKFRASRLDLDYHYNPPGIRGEPRYVEGVVRYTKLHGSIDWRFKGKDIVRCLLPFGAKEEHPENISNPIDNVVIFPNSSKAIETAFYPYSELFRDFSISVCRPNSSIITYGYGFGDSHINNVIEDMLTIPSAHLVVISYDNASGRIEQFYKRNNKSQFTLLIGNDFGDLRILVDYYLPKSAIDRITFRQANLLRNRGALNSEDEPQKISQDDSF